MESTGTANAVVPGFFDNMGSCFSTAKESMSSCASATSTYAHEGSAAAHEYMSAGWSNHVYPFLQALYDLGISLIDQIGAVFQNAMHWVESNPETAQFGLFTCIIGTGIGCLAHYFVAGRAAAIPSKL